MVRIAVALPLAAVLAGSATSAAGSPSPHLGNLPEPPGRDAVTTPAEVDLGGGLIEFLITGRIPPMRQAQTMADGAPVREAAPTRPTPEIAPYDGPHAPGTVILNVTQRKVYRILAGGRMEIHHDRLEAASLAKAASQSLSQ
jgi:hypothetical protein